MAAKKFSDDELRAWVREGLTGREMAERAGASTTAISLRLRRLGLARRQRRASADRAVYGRLQREARRRGLTVPDLVAWLLMTTRDVPTRKSPVVSMVARVPPPARAPRTLSIYVAELDAAAEGAWLRREMRSTGAAHSTAHRLRARGYEAEVRNCTVYARRRP